MSKLCELQHAVAQSTGCCAPRRSRAERYSFPYFAKPRYDVLLQPVVSCAPGFSRSPARVVDMLTEIYRTNRNDEAPGDIELHPVLTQSVAAAG